MAESLWIAIDEHLCTTFDDALRYTETYPVQTVIATAIQSVRDWETWPLPALAVVGVRVRRAPGGHGGPTGTLGGQVQLGLHYDKEMTYRIVAIGEGKQTDATLFAKTLEKRIEATLRGLSWAGVVADDGEVIRQWSVDGSDIAVFPKPRADNTWYGLAIVSLTVRTHI